MVSGKYGMDLVNELYVISSAYGQDPPLISPLPIKEITSETEKCKIRTLPFLYGNGVHLDVSLITSESSEYMLAVSSSDLRQNLEQMVGSQTNTPQEELSDFPGSYFLGKGGKHASETYELLRRRTPQTLSHLRAMLLSYNQWDETSHDKGQSYSLHTPNRNQSKFPNSEMRRRLQRF